MNTLGTKFILANQYIFDPNSNTLFDRKREESVRLGSNESRILLMFVLHPLDVIKRDELHDFVWRQQGFEVDNSSLTQAISTLRKVLNDSTKSPEFVKTVPKRGYQFIATVEKTTAPKSTIQAQQDKEKDTIVPEAEKNIDDKTLTNASLVQSEPPEQIIVDTFPKQQYQSETTVSDQPQEKRKSPKQWPNAVIFYLFLAVVIPIFSFSAGSPKATNFRQVDTYDNVSIEVADNGPDLKRWATAIKLCLGKYKELHPNQALPLRLIATGGLENKLSLNYVFSPENEERNVTITMLADHNEASKVCR